MDPAERQRAVRPAARPDVPQALLPGNQRGHPGGVLVEQRALLGRPVQPHPEGMLAGQGPIDHDGLRFRSCAETRIHDALKRHPVLFFPNAAAVFGGDLEGKKREADFLVCSGGKWGMLEVMGEPYHPPVTAMRDHERARSFKDFGLRVIEFYDAARCLREPEMVVDDFLRRLENS